MSFLWRSKSKRPKPESYQERLRAIGRKLDEDGMRFSALVELPDGFLLKSEQMAARGAGEAATWTSLTTWFKDEDVSALSNTRFEQRDKKRDKR
jgi:hypothetical protein